MRTDIRRQRSEVSLRPIGAYAPVGDQQEEGRGQKCEECGEESRVQA